LPLKYTTPVLYPGRRTDIVINKRGCGEIKTNEVPSSNFCESGFQKYAHVLNELIGSCCLKYAGTKGVVLLYYVYLFVVPGIVSSTRSE
jgi:hypothetical protein